MRSDAILRLHHSRLFLLLVSFMRGTLLVFDDTAESPQLCPRVSHLRPDLPFFGLDLFQVLFLVLFTSRRVRGLAASFRRLRSDSRAG